MALETPASVRKELENAVTQINTILSTFSTQIAELTERVEALESPKRGTKSNAA